PPRQRARHERSDTAVAGDHRMSLQLLRAIALETSERAGAAIVEGADHPDIAQPLGEGLDRTEEDRVQRDRDDGRGDDEVVPLGGEDAELAVDLREDERELADLGEASADDERGPDRVAESQDDAR